MTVAFSAVYKLSYLLTNLLFFGRFCAPRGMLLAGFTTAEQLWSLRDARGLIFCRVMTCSATDLQLAILYRLSSSSSATTRRRRRRDISCRVSCDINDGKTALQRREISRLIRRVQTSHSRERGEQRAVMKSPATTSLCCLQGFLSAKLHVVTTKPASVRSTFPLPHFHTLLH